jgi:hypothetical protein
VQAPAGPLRYFAADDLEIFASTRCTRATYCLGIDCNLRKKQAQAIDSGEHANVYPSHNNCATDLSPDVAKLSVATPVTVAWVKPRPCASGGL